MVQEYVYLEGRNSLPHACVDCGQYHHHQIYVPRYQFKSNYLFACYRLMVERKVMQITEFSGSSAKYNPSLLNI